MAFRHNYFERLNKESSIKYSLEHFFRKPTIEKMSCSVRYFTQYDNLAIVIDQRAKSETEPSTFGL